MFGIMAFGVHVVAILPSVSSPSKQNKMSCPSSNDVLSTANMFLNICYLHVLIIYTIMAYETLAHPTVTLISGMSIHIITH